MITFAITKKSSLNYFAALMGLPERPLQIAVGYQSALWKCFLQLFSQGKLEWTMWTYYNFIDLFGSNQSQKINQLYAPFIS